MQSNLPENIVHKIRNEVLKDLDPKPLVLHSKLFAAVILGGVVSLAICGQFGMGMTSWAEVLSHKIHETMPPLACALICGTVYAVFPTILLRIFLCSPLQFRVILKRKFIALGAWYGTAGISLAIYGQHGQGALEIASWFVAAIGTSYLMAMLFKAFIPLWDLSSHVRSLKP